MQPPDKPKLVGYAMKLDVEMRGRYKLVGTIMTKYFTGSDGVGGWGGGVGGGVKKPFDVCWPHPYEYLYVHLILSKKDLKLANCILFYEFQYL